jgi:hypothetical protein
MMRRVAPGHLLAEVHPLDRGAAEGEDVGLDARRAGRHHDVVHAVLGHVLTDASGVL